MHSHGAAARCLRDDGADVLSLVVHENGRSAPVSEKLRALLRIADRVRVGGRSVSGDDVAEARRHGASDVEIHDAVLVAAAFSMFNRYVDGLATWQPAEPAAYEDAGRRLATVGYAP